MDSRREDSDFELTDQSEWNEGGCYIGSDPIGVFRGLWRLILHCIIIPVLFVAGAFSRWHASYAKSRWTRPTTMSGTAWEIAYNRARYATATDLSTQR